MNINLQWRDDLRNNANKKDELTYIQIHGNMIQRYVRGEDEELNLMETTATPLGAVTGGHTYWVLFSDPGTPPLFQLSSLNEHPLQHEPKTKFSLTSYKVLFIIEFKYQVL